jgi:hypothetical protein
VNRFFRDAFVPRLKDAPVNSTDLLRGGGTRPPKNAYVKSSIETQPGLYRPPTKFSHSSWFRTIGCARRCAIVETTGAKGEPSSVIALAL